MVKWGHGCWVMVEEERVLGLVEGVKWRGEGQGGVCSGPSL